MEFVDSVVSVVALAIVGILLNRSNQRGFERLEAQDAAIREEAAEFRREVREEFRSVRAEMATMRSDITQIALALGMRPRAEGGG